MRPLRDPVQALAAALMALITGVVFFQVLTRYVFQHPFDWPEELARYAFVWVSMLGGALALARGAHFSIDLVTARFSPGTRRAVARLIHLLSAAFCLVVAWQGAVLAWKVSEQLSAAMEISMAIPYAAIPAGFVLMAATLARQAWRGAR